MAKMNLGCGNKTKEGYINLDYHKHPNVDIIHNLNNYPWPFEDNTFEEVLARDILEHLKDIKKAMIEIHRICKDKAILKIQVPHFTSACAFSEEHYHFFRWKSFEDGDDDLDKVLFYGKNFKVKKRKIIFVGESFQHKLLIYNWFIEKIINIWEIPLFYENTFLKNLFPATYIYFELEVVKNG